MYLFRAAEKGSNLHSSIGGEAAFLFICSEWAHTASNQPMLLSVDFRQLLKGGGGVAADCSQEGVPGGVERVLGNQLHKQGRVDVLQLLPHGAHRGVCRQHKLRGGE